MDLINQRNAWAASEISVFIALSAFCVAVIANREKLFEFLTKYCWLVVALFVVVGLWSFYDLGGLMYLANLWHGFAKWMSKGIPIWAIFAAIVVAVGVRWIFRVIAKRLKLDGNTQEPTPPLSAQDFRVEDYIEDLIDGVCWQWTYSGSRVAKIA